MIASPTWSLERSPPTKQPFFLLLAIAITASCSKDAVLASLYIAEKMSRTVVP
jgi:hypothetical protein